MPHTQEIITTNPDLLREVGKEFYEICNQVDIAFSNQNVDLDTLNPEVYWYTIADTTKRLVEEKYSTPENLSPKGFALELIAATPYYVLLQEKFDAVDQKRAERDSLSEDNIRQGVRFMSHYNGLIRDYAMTHPESNTYDLTDSMIEVMEKSGLGKNSESYVNLLSDVISGAQRELIACQSLATQGEGRPTTLVEDIQGIDYVKKLEGNVGLPVDIKASSKKIMRESRGRSTTSCVSRKGTVMLWSQLSERQMAGRFQLSEEEALAHGAKLASEIDRYIGDPLVRRVRYKS